MSIRRLSLALLVGLAAAPAAQAARFTYHGELMDGNAPAQGRYDLEVRAYPAPAGAKALGEAMVLPSVEVKDGRFAVELDLPEDADGMTWVQVGVRASESKAAFTALGERQPISKANSTCPGAWALDGNTGVPAGSFLGIADPAANTPLVLSVKNSAVARFRPNPNPAYGAAPQVVLGSSDNFASGSGATVAGGGSTLDSVGGVCNDCRNFANGNFSTVAGGQSNTAVGEGASVAGGLDNEARLLATVGGGLSNTSAGNYSMVPGGYGNLAGGEKSFAAGLNARVRAAGAAPAIVPAPLVSTDYAGVGEDGDDGSFVWSDNSGAVTRTTGPNQFLVRASGGVGINTSTFGNAVNLRLSELVIRNPDAGGNVDLTLINQTQRGYGLAVVPGSGGAAGEFYISETDARTATVGFTSRFRIDAAGTTFVQGGAVSNLSDARLKKNIAPIARPLDTLLALQGRTFEYIDPAKSMNAPGPRMGFVAQDVQKVIAAWVKPTGAEGYLGVTPIGFEALAVEAIRDLKAESDVRSEASDARSERLETENAMLRSRLDAVLQRLERLEARREH